MTMDDQGISDAFYTVMSLGIVVLAGILIGSIVLSFAGTQGKAEEDRLKGLQDPSLERGISAFYYTMDPAKSDLSSADPNKIPPDRDIEYRTDDSVSVDSSTLPRGAPGSNGLVIWTGYSTVPGEGDYTFSLASAGGAWLWIDGTLIADNHGNHPQASVNSAPLHLAAGQHKIKARYFYSSQVFCKVTSSQNGIAQELRYYH